MAAKLLVMDFEILRRSAILAMPAVSVENQESELCICFVTELDSRIFRKNFDHAETF